jgi:hypothetical protein
MISTNTFRPHLKTLCGKAGAAGSARRIDRFADDEIE